MAKGVAEIMAERVELLGRAQQCDACGEREPASFAGLWRCEHGTFTARYCPECALRDPEPGARGARVYKCRHGAVQIGAQ